MDEYCETFTGGYCELTKTHVPRSWCIDRCQMGKNKLMSDAPESRKLSTPPTGMQMAEHFVKAMTKWAGKGFAMVSKEEYVNRRTECVKCSGGWRCPECGCVIWAKAALATEKCKRGLW